MGTVLLIILHLVFSEPEICIATIFGYAGDKWAGGDALYLKRPVSAEDVGMAHRTLPLGSQVFVINPKTNKGSLATVIDRGPYGAMYEGRWLVKKRRRDPGRWRGCADLTPRLAERIGHDGWDTVHLYPL